MNVKLYFFHLKTLIKTMGIGDWGYEDESERAVSVFQSVAGESV